MPRIHPLPDALINLIAAGEVVERPASVVKELVENALDAGAGAVDVRIEGGGRELIAVADDGCGMDADDAVLAFERHATSKIAAAADLEAIATLGFRGEALPSIAAACRLELETAVADGPGTRVEVEFGRILNVRPCARAHGTTVTVHGLFARLPARLKFLRSEATELRHVVTTVAGLAFTNPAVGFNLAHGARAVLRLPPARDLGQRLPDLVGATRARAARPLHHAAGGVQVTGFLLPPGGPRDLLLAVNGRLVRDRFLAGAATRALRGQGGTLEADAYIAIGLAADAVDVNVHPAKAEVRFADPGRVAAAVTQALAAARTAMHGPAEVRRIVAVPAPTSAARWLPLADTRAAVEPARVREQDSPAAAVTPWGRYIGQYRDTYLLLEDVDALVLVDQHVAHERVLFERLLAQPSHPTVQGLLLPETVELPPSLAALAAEAAPELATLGLELVAASGNSVRVLGVPASLPAGGAADLVARLLADLADAASPADGVRERAAASLACHAAIKKNRPLARAEAEWLLADLAAARDAHRCPHGRPIMLRLPHAEVERRLGRR